MSRIEINEIVESLEGLVEYMGEQTLVYPAKAGVEYEQSLWTCLRDLARCVRDIASTPEDISLDFEGEEDTIDLIIKRSLGAGTPLGQAQLDAMRRLAKEIILLRATCRSAGLSMKDIEYQISEIISNSEVAERKKT
jgi:hypothetical protein